MAIRLAEEARAIDGITAARCGGLCSSASISLKKNDLDDVLICMRKLHELVEGSRAGDEPLPPTLKFTGDTDATLTS